MTSNEIKTMKLAVAECPIRKVAVYRDGACITRSFKIDAKEVGTYKVTVEGITNGCIHSSVSVIGRSCRIIDTTTETVIKARKELSPADMDPTQAKFAGKIEEYKALMVRS